MARKVIRLKHHVDDDACMWNGIGGLCIKSSKEMLLPRFFFVLSSFGSVCHMKADKLEFKRMPAPGDGQTEKNV